jgi:ABC-type transport system involved in multi-copper enzyme maturation permease subunit
MKTLIINELRQFLYGMRVPVSLTLVMVMFAVSSLTHISEYRELTRKYHELTGAQEQQLRDRADNATNVATNRRSYQFSPRNNSFISDCGELNMPNTLAYNVYYDQSFETNSSRSNPFLMPADRINWGFILLTLFSFLAILFSFDAVSGEREQQTLKLTLSNPVKRSYILFGKFVAINLLLVVFALLGMLLALILLMLSPVVHVTDGTFLEIGLFLLLAVFFIGSMTAVGLFASVMCRNSHISLMLSVSLWLFFLLAVPNFSQTLAMRIHPVEKTTVVQTNIKEKYKEIEASFPEGKWSSKGNEPFFPRHEIRANMMMAFAKNETDFRTEHLQKQFRQLEQTRRWTWRSPLAVFGYGEEALLDGGYLRLRKNYDDMRNFKIQYGQWFRALDAKDDESPHWYNPYENYSTTKKPVAYDEIPQYAERSTTIGERLSETVKYLLVMLAYMGVMFVAAILKFERYDVR